jgi:hypothetical protein
MASHTGRQYCAVDSSMTSSTSRSTSQSASARNWAGLVPTFWRSNRYSPSTSTSATTTANIFLCTSIPAIWYGMGSPDEGAESVPRLHHSGSRAIVGPHLKTNDAQLFVQSRTLRIKQLLGLDCSMANLDVAAPRAAILPNPEDFHALSRASRPGPNQLRKSSLTPNQISFQNNNLQPMSVRHESLPLSPLSRSRTSTSARRFPPPPFFLHLATSTPGLPQPAGSLPIV